MTTAIVFAQMLFSMGVVAAAVSASVNASSGREPFAYILAGWSAFLLFCLVRI